ncbi:hypothetical protein EBU71_17525, partial [bacterium]|nr:hypothetical protein [Candidatus Elulimicrobium humile]
TGVDTVWWQCAHMAELGSKVWEISSNGPMFRLVPEEKRFGRLEFGMVWAVREGFLINQDLLQFPHKSFITLAPSTPRVFHKLGKFYNQTNFTDSEWVYSLIQKIELENFVLIDPNYYLIYQDFLADRSQPADSRNYIRNLTKVNYYDNHAKLINLYQDILLKNFLTTRIINAPKIYVMMPFEAPEKDFYHDYVDLGE